MDPTLDYVSKCLLEEEIDELNISTLNSQAALHEIEKTFYDILGQNCPSPNEQLSISCQSEVDSSSTFCPSEAQVGSNSTSKSSMPDTLVERLPVKEFHRGIEEGLKFLPSVTILATDIKEKMISVDNNEVKEEENPIGFRLVEKEDVRIMSRSWIKRNSNSEDLDTSEGRSRKISMISSEEPITNDAYHNALLDHGDDHIKQENWSLQQVLRHEMNSDNSEEIEMLRTELCRLLIHCSEAVAEYNQSKAQELLTKIRMQSSPNGSGIQRLASVLADALQARLAGTGREYYKQLVARRASAPEIFFLKAYHMFLRAAPFPRVHHYFSNHNILNAAKNSRKLHVIDLGIRYGFQWPSLIQALAKREGGPPQLRITGVEFPDPGFHPAKRVENIGRRLEEYARSFDVPLKYKGIALQWESIRMEDLNTNDDEVVVVNSILSFKKLKDDALDISSPRNRVLRLIRSINPQIFIQGEQSTSYSPYFRFRFKQVLSCYSVFFDLLDATIPRENKDKQLWEHVFFVPEIVNIVACEGSDWTDRPEMLKQWQRRNLQAGFEQLPVNPEIVEECKNLVKNFYDKRFFIDEDDNWLLQGWKGRITTGMTALKPKPN